MKKKSLIVAVAVLPISTSVEALDFSAQPRFEAGVMYYDFEQKPVAITTPLGNQAIGDLEISDTMPFIGGGLTLFANRFFVDLSAQYAFDGNDDSSQDFSSFDATFPAFLTATDSAKNDFDRTDYAVSVGYAVLESLAFFAGYKWAETDFDMDSNINGDFNPLIIDPIPFTARASTSSEFEQEGPFVGIAYGWSINRGFFRGGLTGNLAVAFLEGEGNTKIKSIELKAEVDGQEVELEQPELPSISFDGDTVGLSLGLTWRGFTPIEGLTYTAGINGYTYNFDGDNDTIADIQETVINFKAGVGYSF